MKKLSVFFVVVVSALSQDLGNGIQQAGGGGGGSTSPGLPDKSVQFACTGAFCGDSDFVYIPAAGGNPPQFAIGGHVADFTGSNASNISSTASADFYWGGTVPTTNGIAIPKAYAEHGYYFWNPNTSALQDTFYTGSVITYDIPGTGITDQAYYIESVPDYMPELAVRQHLLTVRSPSAFCWDSVDNHNPFTVPTPDTCIQRPLPNTFKFTDGASGLASLQAGSYQESLHTPASSSEACTAGQFSDDASFHYVCVSSGVWKRVALSSF